jgi:hypothetical protein
MTEATHPSSAGAHPVTTLSLTDRIACAAAVLLGRYGDVTRLAQRHGLCRQAVYRHTDTVRDDLDGQSHRQEVLRLRQQLDQAQARGDDLQRRLEQAVVLDEDRQAEFAAVAQAEGVSLPVARRLLGVALRAGTPSVAKLGRWTQAAGARSGALLAVLDEWTRPRVRQAVPDEIFVRRKPILMVAEPQSLCWVSGRLAPRRDGATWAEEFAKLPALEQVTKDGGNGLANGLQQVNAARRRQGLAVAVAQDDHFHVLREGRRALRVSAGQASRAVDRAWKADKKERRRCRSRRAGKRTGHASVVALRWRQAEAAYDRWCRQEQAWQRAASAFVLFDASGQLQTRAQAEADVAAALPALVGPRWAKVRRALARPQLWTYLDRAQEQLAALPVATELRAAAVQVEGLRRRPQALREEGPSAAALRGVLLAAGLVLSLAGPAGAEALARVRGVLAGVWRASSLVEGINSVLRMQQARHRKVTAGLLDLKRLYWNCHRFRTGKRRRRSPYEHLGLRLPAVPWWEVLKWPPEQLRQYLSASEQPSGASGMGAETPAEPHQQLSAPGVAA